MGGGILTGKPVVGLCDDVAQSAGYFNVTTATKNYFYWWVLYGYPRPGPHMYVHLCLTDLLALISGSLSRGVHLLRTH